MPCLSPDKQGIFLFMKYFFSILLSVSLTFSYSQKHDYNWFMATAHAPGNPAYGMSRVDFNTEPPTASKIWNTTLDIDFANVAWSDEDGNYKFLSNGCKILKDNFDVMVDGDSINPGWVYNNFCKWGYPCSSSMLALEHSSDTSKVYVFHLFMDEYVDAWGAAVSDIFLTTISKQPKKGSSWVVQSRNVPNIRDTLCAGQLTAAKHANGKDWWIIAPENSRNGYYFLLLDSSGTRLSHQQYIGEVWDGRDWGGQAVFSPDGRYYVRVDGYSGMQVFEFDRCRGKFYNPVHVDLPLAEGDLYGVAVSSNSRFIYVCSQTTMLQYDIAASDLAASVDTIGIYDGFTSWLPTSFFQLQLAPNGKIYCTTANGTNVMHTIHHPDWKGDSATFVQHDFLLPTYYSFSPPNFPHYRMPAAPANYCDSLATSVSDDAFFEEDVSIYPNPGNSFLNIEFPENSDLYAIQIFNTTGQLIKGLNARSGANLIKLETFDWQNGIYFLVFKHRSGKVFSKKWVKIE